MSVVFTNVRGGNKAYIGVSELFWHVNSLEELFFSLGVYLLCAMS